MNENIKLELRGNAELAFISPNHPTRFVRLKNAINNVVAIETIIRCLAGQTGFPIASIRVYNGVALLATASVTKSVNVAGNPKYVRSIANFTGDSFSGPFTSIQLIVEGIGVFSEITGITESKDVNQPLVITWDINISI